MAKTTTSFESRRTQSSFESVHKPTSGFESVPKPTSSGFEAKIKTDPFFREFEEKRERLLRDFDRDADQWKSSERLFSSVGRKDEPGRKEIDTSSGLYDLVEDEKMFMIRMNVSQFKPEEIKVTTADDQLLIQAEHNEKKCEHEVIHRELKKKFNLPKTVDPSKITSDLSSAGILTVKAVKNPVQKNERTIPVRINRE